MMMSEAQRVMLRTYGTLVGRILIGLLFLVAGIGKLTGDGGVAAFSNNLSDLPLPLLVAWVVVLIEILGGAALILGYRVGLASVAIIIFVVLTVLLIHNPLNDPNQLTAALKNLSIVGGLLYVMAYGPGEGWKLAK